MFLKKKTTVAVAMVLVSMNGMAAETQLSGSSSIPLSSGEYILSDDFELAGTDHVMVTDAKINLNGNALSISSSSTSLESQKGLLNNVEILGKGTVSLTQIGDKYALGATTASITADFITIESKKSYGIWAESTSNIKLSTNEGKGDIAIKSINQSAIYTHGQETEVNIEGFDRLDLISVSETDDGSAIKNNGGTIKIEGNEVYLSSDKRGAFTNQSVEAKTTITANKIEIRSDISYSSEGADKSKYKRSVIDVIAGETLLQADSLLIQANAIENAKDVRAVTVETGGQLSITTKGIAQIVGDVKVEEGELNVKAGTLKIDGNYVVTSGATSDLSFTGSDSYLNGAANVENENSDLSFSQGARWIVGTGSSVQNLSLNGGIIDVTGAGDVQVATLMGASGTIVMDASADNKFVVGEASQTKLTALSSETSDTATVEDARKMIDRLEGVVSENKTAVVEEGYYNGQIIVDGSGNVQTNANTLMSDTLEMGSVTLLSLSRILNNDVRNRLGDVRALSSADGAWARYDNGRFSGLGTENDFSTIQVGYDHNFEENCRAGVAASYTNGDLNFRRGTGDMDVYGFTAYALWSGEKGSFVDLVAQVLRSDSDLSADGNALAGTMKNWAYSLSGEVGHQFKLAQSIFVEPQLEVTYMHIDDDSLDLNEATYEFDSVDSLIGRIGLAAGAKMGNVADVYAKVSLVHEFLGDNRVTGGNGAVQSLDGSDTWVEYGFGGQYKANDATYLWCEVNRTSGALLDADWRASIGLRYAW